ncbi:hypothetical protein ASPTUDRAFT_440707 [Aspergillus tubingensis CBS 134.48]|uniref:Uncharacterized protein n=1 Tax=Aspergillus tubingensis (strain CBS 134.48) TaxID=767770 RepID=A0A1L9N9R5_ASPTC|nr:hypothetical protein ASPTUDRAFT_440707 [Aspergillus tubingensis CBS 134.48]
MGGATATPARLPLHRPSLIPHPPPQLSNIGHLNSPLCIASTSDMNARFRVTGLRLNGHRIYSPGILSIRKPLLLVLTRRQETMPRVT